MRTLRFFAHHRPWRAGLVAFGLALATLAGVQQVQAGPANTATIQFGNPNAPDADQNCVTGPPAPEPCASAFHKLIPGSVAISAPGEVTFDLNGFHHVAVYNPSVRP